MADKGPTGLTAGSDATAAVFHGVEGGNSRKFTGQQIADIEHAHAIADVTGLQAALDAKIDDSQAEAGGLAVLGAANAAAVRAAAGLVIGTDVQAYNANITNRIIAFFFTTTPTDDEVLCLYNAAESITLADDFAGSVGDVGTNPTASFVLDVQVNGASVGSITISTGGAFTFATTGGSVALVSGDQLKVVAPSSADATIANVSITLKGAL
jgi:VCBS repeat-containing protein